MYFRDISIMIEKMEKEYLSMLMAQFTKETGRQTIDKDKVVLLLTIRK